MNKNKSFLQDYILTASRQGKALFFSGIVGLSTIISIQIIPTDSMSPYINAKSLTLALTPFAIKLYSYVSDFAYEPWLMSWISNSNLIISYKLDKDNIYDLPAGSTAICHQAISVTESPNILLTLPRTAFLEYQRYLSQNTPTSKIIVNYILKHFAERVRFENLTGIYLLTLSQNKIIFSLFSFLYANKKTLLSFLMLLLIILILEDNNPTEWG